MTRFARIPLLVLAFVSAAPALANVVASPSFQDLGPVSRGSSRTTTVTFHNFGNLPVRFFNVNCSGDFSAFHCFSMCADLPAYGSCSVQVRFQAWNGDGLRRSIWVRGWGQGGSASATVQATDAKSNFESDEVEAPAARD